MDRTILKRFDNPDETRAFPKGRYDVVRIGGLLIGRAAYDPGWKWSEHVGRPDAVCEVEHVGLVLAGRAAVAMRSGEVYEIRAGDLFHILPGHDSWVLGDETYISLHFHGADEYALPRLS